MAPTVPRPLDRWSIRVLPCRPPVNKRSGAMETKDRTDELEARMATLERRVRRLEAGAPAPWRTSAGSDAPRAGVAAAAPQRAGLAPGDGPRAGVAAADAPRAGVAPGDAARAAGDPAPAAPLVDAARVEE